MRLFYPQMYCKNIYSVPYDKLKKQNISYLLFDLDNTILPSNLNQIDSKTKDFFEQLKKDFCIIMVSNSLKKRVSFVAKQLQIPYYSFSCKPFSKSFRNIKQKYNCEYHQMVLIGDQFFTDVLGGNKLSLCTILIDPISQKDFIFTKISRWAENWLLKNLKKSGFEKGVYYD